MKFYRENNINPASSCLPLLAQFPVFISLFYVLRHFAKEANSPASNLGDLSWLHVVPSIADNVLTHWSGYLLLFIYAASQVASTYFMSATMDKTQRWIMMALPIAFIPLIANFPTGLVLYWMTTNLWTVGQGLVTRRLAPKPQAPPKRTSRTPPKQARTATAPTAQARRQPPPEARPASRASCAGRRSGRGGDRGPVRRGDGRDRRRGEVGGAARARAPAAGHRQDRGPLRGRHRGRARPARRRLRAGAGRRDGRAEAVVAIAPAGRRVDESELAADVRGLRRAHRRRTRRRRPRRGARGSRRPARRLRRAATPAS